MAMDLPERERRVKLSTYDSCGLTRLIISPVVLHTMKSYSEGGMHDLTCMIKGCQAKVYAPAGTHSICRSTFLELSHLASPQRPADVYEVCRDDDGRT